LIDGRTVLSKWAAIDRTDALGQTAAVKTPRHIASARALRLFRSPAGALLTQPWMDGVVLMLLRRYFFPLSRLWALAREAEGNEECFIAGTSSRSWSPRRVRRLRASLAHFERCRLKAYMTEQLWHDYLFGQRGVALERLLIAEEMRLAYAKVLN
jgi:hypothetical protein